LVRAKQGEDLTDDSLNVDWDSTSVDEPKSSVLVVQTVRVIPMLGRITNGHCRQTQGKAMANHPDPYQCAKKTIMNQANTDKSIDANGETPRP